MEVVCFSSHSIGPTNQQRSARARTQQQQNGRSERRGLPVETFARSISGRKLVRLLGRMAARTGRPRVEDETRRVRGLSLRWTTTRRRRPTWRDATRRERRPETEMCVWGREAAAKAEMRSRLVSSYAVCPLLVPTCSPSGCTRCTVDRYVIFVRWDDREGDIASEMMDGWMVLMWHGF